MRENETQLIRDACEGSMAAATELVEAYYPSIYGFLRRLSRNDADAADLTQKTFSRLWSALPRFAGRSSVSSWIHGIAYHVYQDHLRANSRIELRPEAWWEGRLDHAAQPDAQAMDADLTSALYAAVESLEPDLRSPVHLHYYQGLTLEETSAVLGVATSTVKYRLRIAVERLQAQMADQPKLVVQTALPRRI